MSRKRSEKRGGGVSVPVEMVRGLVTAVGKVKAAAVRARVAADQAETAAAKAEVAANQAETAANEVLTRWGLVPIEECRRLFDRERPDLVARMMRPPGWHGNTPLSRLVARSPRSRQPAST